MRLNKIGTLLLVVLLPAAVFAQGSGSTRGRSPFGVTRAVTGTIAEINADDGLLVVEDKKGRGYKFRIDSGTKFKADKKTELLGKKDISLSDFHTGRKVKITYRANDGKVREVRLKRTKKK